MENKLSPNAIIEQLNWRYAVKKFDPTKKISKEKWLALEESLRLAPSSYGLQPWKFLIIETMDIKKKLTPISWGQQQIENASHLVVMTHMKQMDAQYIESYIDDISKTRGVSKESLKGYNDMMVTNVVHGKTPDELTNWTARQVYIAMGAFMTVASMLEIDACPMEGLDPKKYDEVLGLTNTAYKTVAVMAAGYRSADDSLQFAKKVRFKRDSVFKII